MNIDIRTLVIITGIASLLEVIALFLQYRLNKAHQGIGWWAFGFASMVIGYAFIALRGLISIKLITIIAANVLIILGPTFIYIGITRFLDKKENRPIVFSVFAVFLLSFFYYTYFNDNITLRTVIVYAVAGFFSLLTAQSLFFYKTRLITTSAYFNAALLLINGCFFAFRAVETLTIDPVQGLFNPALMQAVSFLVLFVYGILLTFGLIIMVNQRLNAENSEAKENMELIFNTSPDAVLVTRLHDGYFVGINDGFTVLTGYTRAEVIGKSSLDINLWKNPAERQQVAATLTEKGFCENLEAVFQRKDGSQLTAMISARIITLQGAPHIISVTRDITERKQAENILQQTRHNYETFFNTIDEFLFVLDEQGSIIHTNSTVIDRLGYTKEELLGQSVLMVHPPQRRDEAGRIVGEMLNGTAEFCPVPIITKSGVQIPVETRVSHGFWDGKTAIFGVTKDIARLRLSEEKFSKVFYINPSICGLSDLDTGKYVEVNEAFYTLLGFDKEEVIGKTATELGILTLEAMNTILLKADSNGNVANVETDLKAKNGDIKHVLLSLDNILVQDKSYRFTVVYDVTAQKQAEEDLKQTSARLLLATRAGGVGVWDYDIVNNILLWDDQMFALYGVDKDTFVGAYGAWLAGVHPDDAAQADKEIQMAIRGEKEFDTEFRVLWPDNSIHTIRAIAIVQRNDSGKALRMIGTNWDITAQKQAEVQKAELENQNRQLHKSESLGRMAAAIAHHFNNKLGAVTGNLELALMDVKKGVQPQAHISAAMESSLNAAAMSRQMITYLGQSLDKREQLDLSNSCLLDLPLLLAVMPRNVVLNADLPSPGPEIKANANQIQQVLTNLITNAREAAEEGGGAIFLSVKKVSAAEISAKNRFPIDWQQQDDAYACLEVADTGCGIDEKDIEKLFDPFYSTKFTGRGMGLAVVMGIVKTFKGVLTVESKPKNGSTFRVFFPLSEEAQRQTQKAMNGGEAKIGAPFPGKMEEGGTVLVVEDEEILLDMAATMMEDLGFFALKAKDGIEALDVFWQNREKIRFVLTDLTMPRMGGWETLTALRKLQPDIPVILASGYDLAHMMEGDHPELPQAFLAKPYNRRALSDAIGIAIGKKEG